MLTNKKVSVSEMEATAMLMLSKDWHISKKNSLPTYEKKRKPLNMSHRVFLWRLFFALSILSSSLSAQTSIPVYDRYDSLRGALNPLRSCYDVSYITCTCRSILPDSSVKGFNEIRFSGTNTSEKIQLDLFPFGASTALCKNTRLFLISATSDLFYTIKETSSQRRSKKASRYIIMDIRWLPRKRHGTEVLCGAKIH